MNAKTDQANRAAAALAAKSLKARLLLSRSNTVLGHASTDQLTETIADLAEDFGGNVFAASATLSSMTELERLEALGFEEDDPKSYMAARYAA